MGLDGVEMVMATEERFGITISDAEAELIRTPGMLIDLVVSKVHLNSERFCRSQRAFYLLRRALHTTFGIERSAIRPRSQIRMLNTGQAPELFWPKLRASVGARSWPPLEIPLALQNAHRFAALGTFAILSASSYFLATKVLSPTAFVMSLIGFGLSITLPFKLHSFLQERSSSQRKYLPHTVQLVSDLVPFVETSESIVWNRESVAIEIRKIVMDNLCPKPEKYSEEADFVRDLGLI